MRETNRNIVVIGASAGGIEAMRKLLAQLPAELAAAILVVQHTGPQSPGYLADILDRAGPLPVGFARDGETVESGRVYVAPADCHLLLGENSVLLSRGPRENRARPAIDPLFRSAAVHHNSRVIGLLLSGYLSDGTAGLLAVKRCGGMAVVLDPADTLYPDMPRNALAQIEVDRVLPLAAMGELLIRAVNEPAGPLVPVPVELALEAAVHDSTESESERNDDLGHRVAITCPDCGGPLWELDRDGLQRYRCHLGHGFAAPDLLAAHGEGVERALWDALRIMEERRNVLTVMVNGAREKGRELSARELAGRLEETVTNVRYLRQFLLSSFRPPEKAARD